MFAGKLRSILDPLNSIRDPLDPFSKLKNSASSCRICRELVPVEVGAGPRGCSVPGWFRGFSLHTSPPMRCDVCVCVYIYICIHRHIYICIHRHNHIYVSVHASDFVRCSLANVTLCHTFLPRVRFGIPGYHLGLSIPIRSQP